VGDLVIWDNRATMHRGIAFDDRKYRRELRRVTTLDIPTPAHLRSDACTQRKDAKEKQKQRE